jgi:hypothetical protein
VHRPWRDRPLPAEVSRIPAMLTEEERQYLCWLTAERYSGQGAVVDLGPWLGGSSAALACGLAGRRDGARVHSLDLFAWSEHYMSRAVAGRNLPALAEGGDFLPLFLEQTRPFAARIAPRRVDLLQARWSDGPIEILFVDAAKSWALLSAILRAFGPSLQPGQSRIVLQDFRDWRTHWLPLVFAGRPDLFAEVESVARGTTVTLTPRRALDGPGGLAAEYREDSFAPAEGEAIYARCIAREAPEHHAGYRLAAMRHAMLRHDDRRAAELRTQALLHHRDVPDFAEQLAEAVRAAATERLSAATVRARAKLDAGEARDGESDLLRELTMAESADRDSVRRAMRCLERAWHVLQDGALAEDGLRRLEPIHGDHADYRLLQSLVLCALGRRDEGRAALQRALALAPDHPRAAALLAERFPN